jgi:hypothetical protein
VRQAKKRLKTVSSAVETLMIILLKIFGDSTVLFFDIADALSYTADYWELPARRRRSVALRIGMAGSLFKD